MTRSVEHDLNEILIIRLHYIIFTFHSTYTFLNLLFLDDFNIYVFSYSFISAVLFIVSNMIQTLGLEERPKFEKLVNYITNANIVMSFFVVIVLVSPLKNDFMSYPLVKIGMIMNLTEKMMYIPVVLFCSRI